MKATERFGMTGMLRPLLVTLLLVLAGCGDNTGLKELKDGWAVYEKHDLKKALKLFEKSVAKNPSSVDALVASARVKLELGELAAAKETLAQAAVYAPNDADVILLGAQVAYHAKDYRHATETLTRFATDGKRDAKLRAEAHVALAVVEMTCNEHERARVALMKALLLDRRCAAARYHLGRLYRDLGYDEAALEQFEAFVRLDTATNARVQRVQRQIIPALKDALARKATERPRAAQRNSAVAAKNLREAEAAMKKNDFKKAKSLYESAVKADALSYDAALGLAQMTEKTETTPQGRRNALSHYKNACALKPSAIKTMLKTGNLALALESPALAAEAYSRAIAADPKNTEAIDGYIRALRKTGSAGIQGAALWQDYRDQLKKRK